MTNSILDERHSAPDIAIISDERGPRVDCNDLPFEPDHLKWEQVYLSDEERSQQASTTNQQVSPAENVLLQLDPKETKPSKQIKPTYRAQFMDGKEAEYSATHLAYFTIWGDGLSPKVSHLENCRRHAYFARDRSSGDVRIMTNSCRERWCPMCAGQKSKYAKESVRHWIETLKAPRFLTLTLKHCEEPLKPQIEFLQDAFRRLRYRAYWKRNVFGGIWFLQVHRSSHDGLWHPHLHILLDGHYMEKHDLSALWDLVTFGSPVIDIRRVDNPEKAAEYVARYSARPAQLEKMSLGDRVEMILALQGKRLSGAFGTAKCVTLTPPKTDDGCEWQRIGFYDQVIKDAATNPAALSIIRAWAQEIPLTETEYCDYTGIDVNPVMITKCEPQVIQYNLDFFNT